MQGLSTTVTHKFLQYFTLERFRLLLHADLGRVSSFSQSPSLGLREMLSEHVELLDVGSCLCQQLYHLHTHTHKHEENVS